VFAAWALDKLDLQIKIVAPHFTGLEVTLTPFGTRLVGASALVVFCGAAPGWATRQDDLRRSPDQIREFLLTAKVVKHKDLGKGIMSHPADAHRRHADARRPRFLRIQHRRLPPRRTGRHDAVTVEREWDHRKGSLTWWIDATMDEETRMKQKRQPPDREDWNRQMYRMRVFAQLVADTDRNLGNVLIGPDWKLWMIDFTRAFRRTRKLLAPGDLQRCDRQLLARLRELTAEAVEAKTAPFIGRAEIEPLMARRDAIVTTFEKLIAERGTSDRITVILNWKPKRLALPVRKHRLRGPLQLLRLLQPMGDLVPTRDR
jgi:hypothetical protein